MNTKAAVILMIGLLGMPAVFNFTNTKQMANPGQQPMAGPRWSVVPVAENKQFERNAPAWGILLDNRTGTVRYLLSGLAGPEGGEFFTNQRVSMSKPTTPNP